MNTTSASLLDRVRRPNEQAAWERFVQLYTPLLVFWSRRLGLQDQDAADLVQEVFVILVRKMPEFEYERKLGFRNWLRTVLFNQWRQRGRRRILPTTDVADLDALVAPELDEAFGEAEYRQYLAKRCLQLMQSEFPPKMWQACWRHIVLDRPAADVAAELGIAVGTVYVAKSRVLRRLREELRDFLD